MQERAFQRDASHSVLDGISGWVADVDWVPQCMCFWGSAVRVSAYVPRSALWHTWYGSQAQLDGQWNTFLFPVMKSPVCRSLSC